MESLSYEECKPFLPIMDTAKCVRVYDGDTLHLGIVLPAPYGATRFICRLLGVDTPELRSQNLAEKALARLAREELKNLTLHKIVRVRVAGIDKYGRLLVRVGIDDIEDLSTHLIQKKLAVYYDGGRKSSVSWENMLSKHSETTATTTTDFEERNAPGQTDAFCNPNHNFFLTKA